MPQQLCCLLCKHIRGRKLVTGATDEQAWDAGVLYWFQVGQGLQEEPRTPPHGAKTTTYTGKRGGDECVGILCS